LNILKLHASKSDVLGKLFKGQDDTTTTSIVITGI
jgi:hypothetical protein